MLERWTVDAIAGEIGRQLQSAEVAPQLVRRFYKQGKRHGKRSIISEPAQTLIVNAIDIATSKIAEQFVAEAQRLRASVAAADARLATPLPPPVEPAAPEEAAAISSPGTRGPDLSGALTGVRHRKIEETRRAAHAQHAAKQEELAGVAQSRAVAQQALRDLPSHYRQAVESCHEAGELLWSRYRSGYVEGASRRGPSDAGSAPPQSISFDAPPVFDLLVPLADPERPTTEGVS